MAKSSLLTVATLGMTMACTPGLADPSSQRPAHTIVSTGDASIELVIEAGDLAVTHDQLLAWVRASARAVARYYGRFPVSHLRLVIVPAAGARVLTGTTWGRPEARIRVLVGIRATADALAADWVLPHEMTHLAFPGVDRRHHWLEEGLATYVEPIARVQSGDLVPADVWRQLVAGLPKGLPRASGLGLDQTPTWGATYWGGALFCLLADLRIRERTRNQLGLQDALRGILAAGGTIEEEWPLEQALRAGDQAVGGSVLWDLYQQMGRLPHPVDLDELWTRLGIRARGTEITFDDTAPGSAIRRAITAAMPATGPVRPSPGGAPL